MDVKKIETTIGALVAAEPALKRLATLKLDAKTRYHAVKLLRLVSAETKAHFYEPREAVFKELGTERPSTTPEERQLGPTVLVVPPDKTLALNAVIQDLVSVAVQLPWGPITSTMLEPYLEFSAADMDALGPLCVLDEPNTPESLPEKSI